MSDDDDEDPGPEQQRHVAPREHDGLARGDDDPDDDRDDPMGPPREPCECWCMHCRRTFMSNEMWFQRVIGDPQGFRGFWMCPTPNCSGAGFTFDIFPTDPDHPANEGWYGDGGEDDEAYDEDEEDPDLEDPEGIFAGEHGPGGGEADEAAEWDPNESHWKELDETLGDADDDDDIEGEEWKHGLAPGERPPPRAPASWSEEARQEWEAEQRSYDEPDRRPRELDWSDRPPRPKPKPGDLTEDDIPF